MICSLCREHPASHAMRLGKVLKLVCPVCILSKGLAVRFDTLQLRHPSRKEHRKQ